MQLRSLLLPAALLVSVPVFAQDAAQAAQLEVPDFRGVAVSHGTRVEASPERSIEGVLSGGSTVKAGKKPASVQVNSSGGSQVRYE